MDNALCIDLRARGVLLGAVIQAARMCSLVYVFVPVVAPHQDSVGVRMVSSHNW